MPTGVLWQNGPLEWVHFPTQTKKVAASYPGLIATLILKEKSGALNYLVKSHQKIVIPYNKKQVDALLMFDENLQVATENCFGQSLTSFTLQCFVKFYI